VRLYLFVVRGGLRSMAQRLVIPARHLASVRELDHR
jgi:hypothetical protein